MLVLFDKVRLLVNAGLLVNDGLGHRLEYIVLQHNQAKYLLESELVLFLLVVDEAFGEVAWHAKRDRVARVFAVDLEDLQM
jgi:hypothetical protein